MKRIWQKVQTYKFDDSENAVRNKIAGQIKTEKSSFGTLEKAIEDAWFWINKEESWIDTTVLHIEIINKETKEVVWTYNAE